MKFFVFIISFFPFFLFSQVHADENKVIKGKLNNGLTYYIKHIPAADKVNMRLYIKTGFFNEDPDQLELSHLLEHTIFDGTKHFPNPTDFFRSRGIAYGSGLNATTTDKFTTYQINNIPLDSIELPVASLRFFADILGNVLFRNEDIDTNRKEIIEEFRKDGDHTKYDEFGRLMTKCSDFKYKPAKQHTANILGFSREYLVKYYQTWYRPDLSAIVIIGNVAKWPDLPDLIRSCFSSLKNNSRRVSNNPHFRKCDTANIVFNKGNSSSVELYYELPHTRLSSWRDYYFKFKCELLCELLEKRYKQSDLVTVSYSIMPSFNAPALAVNGGSDSMNARQLCLRAFEEVERIHRYGFTNGDLHHAIKTLKSKELNDILEIWEEKILNNILDDAPLFAIEEINNRRHHFLDTLSIKCLNGFIKELIPANPIGIVTAKSSDSSLQDIASISLWINEIDRSDIQPLKKDNNKHPVISIPSVQVSTGHIAGKRDITGLHAAEVKLNNGIKVLLRPSVDSKVNRVNISGVLHDDVFPVAGLVDSLSYRYASLLINQNGIGSLSVNDLRIIKGTYNLSLFSSLNNFSGSINGRAPANEAELLLKLMYLTITHPQISIKSVQELIASFGRQLSAETFPSNKFRQIVNTTLLKEEIVGNEPQKAYNELPQVNIDSALAMYQRLFSAGNHLTFVITGNFQMEEMLILIDKYLGSLPSISLNIIPSSNAEKLKAAKYRALQKPLIQTFPIGSNEDMAEMFFGYQVTTGKQVNKWPYLIAKEIIDKILRDRIREKEGMVYALVTSIDEDDLKNGLLTLKTSLACAPENTEKIGRVVKEEIHHVQTDGISEQNFQIAKTAIASKYEMDIKTEAYWLLHLKDAAKYNTSLAELEDEGQQINAVTKKEVEECLQLLKDESFFQFTMLPNK